MEAYLDDTPNEAGLDASSRLDVKPPGSSRSTPGSRYASRVPSRVGSRAGSRVDLRMTATMSSMPSRSDGPRDTLPAEAQAVADLEPDFVDLDEWDREEEEEVVAVMDEGEMRKLVLGRVGGWVDWMVGWMDLRGLGEEDGDEGMGEEEEVVVDETVDEVKAKAREGWRLLGEGDRGDVDGGSGLPAPGPGGGAWEDAKWLLRIAVDSL